MAKFLLVKGVKISGFEQNVAVNVDKIKRITEEQVTVDGEMRTRCVILLNDDKVRVYTELNTLLNEIEQLERVYAVN